MKSNGLITQKEYASRKGWSPQYVSKLIKQGKLPTVGRKIDPKAADAALEQQSSTLAEALRRKTQAQAEREELKLAIARNEVVPIWLVRQKQEQINGVIRARLLAIPTKMAMILADSSAAEIKAKLDIEIYEVLSELSSPATWR
jgi:multidrug resistance efflux pump